MIKVFSTRLLSASDKESTAQEGLEITDCRFIRVTPVLDGVLQDTVSSRLTTPRQAVIFTSKNAVKVTFDYYLRDIPKDILQSWEFYCLSGATREMLLQYVHPQQILGIAGYASDLAPLIKKRKADQTLHFFCGNKRRDTLPRFMEAHDISFKEWVVYKTELTPSAIEEEYEGYLFYSPSAVKSFFLKNIIAADKPCFTIGTTTAAAVDSQVLNPVFSSPKTNTKALLQLVLNYFKGKNGTQTEK